MYEYMLYMNLSVSKLFTSMTDELWLESASSNVLLPIKPSFDFPINTIYSIYKLAESSM